MTYKNLKRLAKLRKIVLGSGSPRRLELLRETGIEFRQNVSGISEPEHQDGDPYEHARELADEKALSIAHGLKSDEMVIAADTVVVLNGKAMSKPKDKTEAADFLRVLSGKSHVVCTALAIADREKIFFHRELPVMVSGVIL